MNFPDYSFVGAEKIPDSGGFGGDVCPSASSPASPRATAGTAGTAGTAPPAWAAFGTCAPIKPLILTLQGPNQTN